MHEFTHATYLNKCPSHCTAAVGRRQIRCCFYVHIYVKFNPQLTRAAVSHSQAPRKRGGTGSNWTDQQLEEPETRFVVAGFEGVDEEEHHEAVEDQGVDLHGDVDVLRVQAGEDAEAPQHAQEPCDLPETEEGGAKTRSEYSALQRKLAVGVSAI